MTYRIEKMYTDSVAFLSDVVSDFAELIAEHFEVSQLGAVMLIFSGITSQIFAVSPRGLAAWLRAQADVVDAHALGDMVAKAAADDRLKAAMAVIRDDYRQGVAPARWRAS